MADNFKKGSHDLKEQSTEDFEEVNDTKLSSNN